MSDNTEKAQCKPFFHFFLQNSISTLKNRITRPHCEALKSISEARQSSMSRDESVFLYNSDAVREQFAGLVIQEGLPFNHFDNTRMTRVFQNHLQSNVNVTTDVWTVPHGFPDSYVCVIAHWIETGTWKMMKRAIAFEDFTVPHTGGALFRMLKRVFAHFHLEDKKISVTLDKSSNNTKAIGVFDDDFATKENERFTVYFKDRLDSQDRIQNTSSLKHSLDFEEDILEEEVQDNEAIPLSEEEIALDEAANEARFWRNWIKACRNSAYALVLINGSPSKEFKVERGLRQGDHLSSFFFILAVEALNVILVEAKNKNKFHGIEVGKDKTYISHLQFADDALIMGEWSLTNAKNLSRILTCFHLASGLKVNFNKSKLFGVRVTPLEVNSIALSIGCQPSQFLCIYLGLPICANMSRCANWSPLTDRFLKRLSRWKSKTLSFGGRLTLIKSVLGGLGVYYFSTFKAPKKIIDKFESIRGNFFWGASLVTQKFPGFHGTRPC
uniref:Reverse transcriptase domain, reverse transcriptase zinc-binding domain protein n=1 Tax=Tanacetum cinerariifolium TaxID=118510 RepID=A0A699HMU6_TANCI|nr:reverse transcriptase domain, reverse transcriptase zinc-binding domain protein [Tanacetum cinerariifolium]